MDERLTVGSLFSGIGGFDLGFGRAGMRTLWFCEQDPFCRRVLAKHWPGVPCHPDVRALVADTAGSRPIQQLHATAHAQASEGADQDGQLANQGTERCGLSRVVAGEGPAASNDRGLPVPVPYVDVLCGGFPCQDISLAGRGAGLAGERSGLWREFARLIGELRPRYVVVENVPALTSRGLDVVLADLAACGFDAEWDHLPASAFGAPHRRDRIWLVAYPDGEGQPGVAGDAQPGRGVMVQGGSGDVPHPGCDELREQPGRCGGQGRAGQALAGVDGETRAVADPDGTAGNGTWPTSEALPRPREVERPRRRGSSDGGHWLAEPAVGRVANGIPHRVDRLRALGNSLVPQIAEWIGRRIVKYENLNDGQEAA